MKIEDLTVASYYILPPDPVLNGQPVTLERAWQRDGACLWAVREVGYCLTRDGRWEHEPIPSERGNDFLGRCRFGTPEEALQVWAAHCTGAAKEGAE